MSETTPIELLTHRIGRYLAHPKELGKIESRFRGSIPAEQQANAEAVITAKAKSYAPALLVQLAYGLTSPQRLDITKRHEGARGLAGVAGKLGTFLAQHHIPCAVPDAFQNVGKNTADLVRGHFDEWDSLLTWASQDATRQQLETLFSYACARIAATSRPISPMPKLNLAALTFTSMSKLLHRMFDTPSEGAHEQFITAALLHALIEQSGLQGYRVETKKLNASDSSSKVAGDIQILTGSRTLEAYEVTANEWGSKIDRAGKTIREHDLSRLHIIAKVNAEEHDAMLTRIASLRDDVSVIEIRGYAAAITAALTKPFRAVALERLYQFLDRYQTNVGRVNNYVALLHAEHLTLSEEAAG